MGLCIDVGHTIRTGTDPVQACLECKDRLYDMHVKDLKVTTDKDSQVEVGRGVLDFPGLFRALLEASATRARSGLEYRDQGRRAAARHAGVALLHAGRARGAHDVGERYGSGRLIGLQVDGLQVRPVDRNNLTAPDQPDQPDQPRFRSGSTFLLSHLFPVTTRVTNAGDCRRVRSVRTRVGVTTASPR